MPTVGQRRKLTRKKHSLTTHCGNLNTKYHWMQWFKTISRLVKDLFFPRRCFVCDQILSFWEYEKGVHDSCTTEYMLTGKVVCAHCGARLFSESEYCSACGGEHREYSYFEQGKAVFVYQKRMKKTMYRFKYYNRQEYALAFAKFAVQMYGDWIEKSMASVIVPVPIHPRKMRLRGYNQAEVFARELACELERQRGIKLKVLTKGITRSSDTAPLKTMQKIDRYFNLKNAFQISPSVLKYGKIALVVDDIYTTGATANSLSSSLRNAGFQNIYFLSICIGNGL